MPSPDYLEAGKFKLQKGIGSLSSKLGLSETSPDVALQYQAAYTEKLQVS